MKCHSTMIEFKQYVNDILIALKANGIPTMTLKGLCDDDGLFPGADCYGSIGICIADNFQGLLGHGDIWIYKETHNGVKGLLLDNVSSEKLSIIKRERKLYDAEYKTIEHRYSNNYAIYF